MELGLHGQTAIVTGASQGIGLSIARAFHAEGITLALVARTEQKLREAARAIAGSDAPRTPIHTLTADLTLRSEIERVASQAIERMGHVDILVNNAARAHTGNFFTMSDEVLQEAWQVKGFGYVGMVRAIAPHMMERHSGNIINIVGSAARTPTEDFIIGSMVNAALVNFTRGISRELGRHNVRINSISPGWTLTERQQRQFEMEAAAKGVTLEEYAERQSRIIPLNRLVTMDEIARLALLLASGTLPALTGEDIVLDGGATRSI